MSLNRVTKNMYMNFARNPDIVGKECFMFEADVIPQFLYAKGNKPEQQGKRIGYVVFTENMEPIFMIGEEEQAPEVEPEPIHIKHDEPKPQHHGSKNPFSKKS